MARARPCIICRRWSVPDPRVGKRQRTCGLPECQQELHRRNCQRWRARNGHIEREGRLRERVSRQGSSQGAGESTNQPEQAIDWSVVRDEMGSKAAVILEEIVRLALERLRDEIRAQLHGSKRKSGQHAHGAPRDGTDAGGPAP